MPPGCAIGHALLQKFRAQIEALPISVGIADERHPLAAFSGNPVGSVGEEEDAWEKFDGPLNTLLRRPGTSRGKDLIALCRILLPIIKLAECYWKDNLDV